MFLRLNHPLIIALLRSTYCIWMIFWFCKKSLISLLLSSIFVFNFMSNLVKAVQLKLQTYQILTNDDQMLILCLSYFITTVQSYTYIASSNSKMKQTQTTCIKKFNVTFVCIFDSLFANKYVCVLEMIVNHVYGHYCLLSLVLSGYCKTWIMICIIY